MVLQKVTENITTFRKNIILGGFIVLIILPSFFSGEWSKWLQSILYIISFLVLLFIILVYAPKNNPSFSNKKIITHPLFYLLLFLMTVLVVSFFSSNYYVSFNFLFLLFTYGGICITAFLFFREWRYIKVVALAVLTSTILAAVIALIMYLNQSYDRATGLLFNANALGGYLLFGLPLGFTLLIAAKSWKAKYIYGVSTVVIAIALWLSYSFTAWVSLIVPIVVLLFYFKKKIFTKKSLVVFLISLVVVSLGLVLFRFQQNNDLGEAIKIYETIPTESVIRSFYQRLNFNRSAIDIFFDHLLTGSGLDTFQSTYGRYAYSVIEQPRYAHNYFLQTAAETGFFGLVFFGAFIVFLVIQIYRVVKYESDYSRKIVLLGLGLGVIGSTIHALFDFSWQFPAVFILFWLVCGMCLGWRSRQSGGESYNLSERGSKLVKITKAVGIILAIVILLRGITVFLGAYYFDAAERAVNRETLGEVAEYYNNGLQYDPDTLMLSNYIQERLRYNFLMTTDDFKILEDKARSGLALSPEEYFLHRALGRLYFEQGKYDLAIESYSKAIEYNPLFRPDYYYDLAIVYYEQEEYQKAKEIMYSILRYYPPGINTSNPNMKVQLAFLRTLLGQVYEQQGNKKQALIQYEMALTIKPDFELAKSKLEEMSRDVLD